MQVNAFIEVSIELQGDRKRSTRLPPLQAKLLDLHEDLFVSRLISITSAVSPGTTVALLGGGASDFPIPRPQLHIKIDEVIHREGSDVISLLAHKSFSDISELESYTLALIDEFGFGYDAEE